MAGRGTQGVGVLAAGVFVAALVGARADFARAQRRPSVAGGPRRGAWQGVDAGPDVSTGVDAAVDDGAAGDARSSGAERVLAAREFQAGYEAFQRGDYAGAARHFRAAHQALPDPATLYNLALSLQGAMDVGPAIEAYERYLAESSAGAADRAIVEERLRHLRTMPMPVTVASDPPGATVFVDLEAVPVATVTPTTLRLVPGTHVVTLERQGYHRAVRRVEVRAGRPETLSLALASDGSAPHTDAPDPRLAARRVGRLLWPRFSLLLGLGRSVPGSGLQPLVGASAALYLGRSFATKLHFERFEPDGFWTLMTADVGYVFLLEDLDIGFFATAGAAYGPLDAVRPDARTLVPVGGAEFRVDWQFHRYLALGLYFRATWRNFFVAPIESLNSFGLSVSLVL